MAYWAIFPLQYDDGAVLTDVPEDGPEDFEYDLGKSLARQFPAQEEAIMVFDIDYPEGIKLYDFVPALDSVLVVSSKVQDLLNRLKLENMEFLPLTLLDHKGKVASKDYSILNVIGSLEFIDMSKSDYDEDPLDEGQIARMKNLVINESKVPESAKIFRAKTMMDQFFIHDDVKIAFEEAGIKGYSLFDADGWDGLEV